jgi:hypothetical protein
VRFPIKTGLYLLAPLAAFLLAGWFLHAQQKDSQVIATAGTKYDLTASDLSIPLKPQTGNSLGKELDALRSSLRLYLRLSHLQAGRQPGVSYAIYLEPLGTVTRSDAFRVGYINFFSVGAGSKGNPFVFEVTGLVRELLHVRPNLSGLQVSIAPGGPPESTPSIGSIELIAN